MNAISFTSIYPQLKKLDQHSLEMTVLFSHLLIKAKKKQLTNYRTPAQAMGLFSAGLGGHLEELFKINIDMKDPLYGAVIVNKESNLPSKGFFDAAIRHNLRDELNEKDDQASFWEEQKNKVFTMASNELAMDKLNEVAPDLTEEQKKAIMKIFKDKVK